MQNTVNKQHERPSVRTCTASVYLVRTEGRLPTVPTCFELTGGHRRWSHMLTYRVPLCVHPCRPPRSTTSIEHRPSTPTPLRYFEWNPFSCLQDPSWLALMHNIQATQSPMLHLYLTATSAPDRLPVGAPPLAEGHKQKANDELAYRYGIFRRSYQRSYQRSY